MKSQPIPQIRYILDTNIVTYHQLGRTGVSNRIRQAKPGEVATTVITLFEQLRGRLAEINRNQTDAQFQLACARLQVAQAYYCTVRVLPFDEQASQIYRSLIALKLRPGVQDLRIASIALAHQAILVTANRRDFEKIPNLKWEDWSAVV